MSDIEKRRFFRIEFYTLPATITFNGRTMEVQVKDISGNGIGFYSDEELEFDVCTIEFSVKKETFICSVQKVRGFKSDHAYLNGCQFLNLSEKDRKRLSSLLFRIDAERRRS